MTADTWTDHNWRPKLWTRDAHGKNLNIANKILYRGRVSIIASLIIAEGYEKQNSQHKSILSVLNGSIHRMGSSLWECHYGRAELRFGAPSDQAPSVCAVRMADKAELEMISKKILLKKSVFRGGAYV